ncbi:MAG: histidine phosphatase family protein [Tepidisphaeraceae bacterium]
MRIFFVRHGESEANILKIFSNRQWKHPLTERGREQAKALAAQLRGRGVAAIHSSPLRRAIESAEILAGRLGVEYVIEPALIEYDVGIYEDRSDEEGWRAYADVERQWAQGQLDARLPEGESSLDIQNRFVPFIRRLINLYGKREDATVVLIGHGGTYRQGLPCVLGNISRKYAVEHGLANTAVVEAELREGVLHCVSWGDRVMA